MNKLSSSLCSLVLLIILAGGVLGGEVVPTPAVPQPHSTISNPAKHGGHSNSTSKGRSLTWLEIVEIALSNLGLL